MSTRRSLLVLALAVGCSVLASADVIVLRDGDRISGRILSEGTRIIRLQTPYGRLAIPRSKIERILRDDGRVRDLGPVREVLKDAPVFPRGPLLRLVLVITGKTFWQAWSPTKGSAPDSTLRLQVRLDEEPVATYEDPSLENDIPGALVNVFSFAPEDVSTHPASGVEMLPPETRPGRIVLKIDVPRGQGTRRRLGLAYQVREPESEAAWRDLVGTAVDVEMRTDGPTFVQVQQDRGRMEFSGFPRRRMKNVETFKIEARAEP